MNDTATTEAPSVLTEIKSLAAPDMSMLNRGAASALRMAQSFVITTDDDYQLAGEELQSVKSRITKMEATRTGITGPMNKALTAINDLFRGPMATLKSAEGAIKSSMLTYHTEQERKAAELRRIEEAKAEAERKRIAAEALKIEQAAAAERQRIAAEAAAVAAQAKAAQDKADQEAAAAVAAGNQAAAAEIQRSAEAARQVAAQQAQEAAERQAETDARAMESAAALRSEVSVISAAVTHIDNAKASGTSVRATVEYEVTDKLALVQHIAANPALINLVIEDSVKLRAYVRGLGMNTNLPGVRVYQKRSMSARAA